MLKELAFWMRTNMANLCEYGLFMMWHKWCYKPSCSMVAYSMKEDEWAPWYRMSFKTCRLFVCLYAQNCK